MLDRKGTHWSTRLFAAFLAFVMLLGNVPANVFATEITGEERQETSAPVPDETEPRIADDVDLFVFAGQSNMMGAAVLEPEVDAFTEKALEYKYLPKLRGAEAGSFVAAQNPAGEFHYMDLTAAYGDKLSDLSYQSSLSNYSSNTYFCPAMRDGVKGFSAQSEADTYPSASLAPYFVTEYASYGHSSVYAHMAKGAVKIDHYFTEEMVGRYNALISEYNTHNNKSYSALSLTGLSGAGDAFDDKYNAMLEDYTALSPDNTVKNKCFVWLQGEGDAGRSYIEYKLKLQVLWEHLQDLGFTHFFVLRVGYWGSTGILNVIKAQEDFCAENENCYIVTRAPSLIPHPSATTANWWISEPSEEYDDCRDSYVVDSSNNHFNEKAMQIFAERSAENVHRILHLGLEPVLEEENIQGMVTEEKPDENLPEDTTPYTSYLGTEVFCNSLSVSQKSNVWKEPSSSSAASTDLIPVKSTDSVWHQYVFFLSEAHAVGGFYDEDGKLVAPLYYKDFGFTLGGAGGTAAFRTPDTTNRVSIAAIESATGKKIAFVRFTAWQVSKGGHANTEARIYHEEGHSHSYEPIVTASTCTEQGYTTHTCTCGDSYVDSYVDAAGHSYENGKCARCGDTFAGKTVSILSHSMSTYAGVSNNTAYNSTIGNNDVYYTEGRHGVYRKDTWWQQAIDALGMKLLVNNSWSGSCVFQPRKGAASVGYGDRAVNLHNDHTGEEPDIIWVYLGCNDFAYYQDTFGKAADVDYSALIKDNGDGTFTYAAPQTACEAYAIMLHKAQTRYPDAKIYCMTSTARREVDYTGDSYPDAGQPTEYVAQLQAVAAHFGYPVVDLEKAIPKEVELFDKYMGDKRAHANALGMDQITQALVRTMLGEEVTLYDVSGEYHAVNTDNGAAAAVSGMSYTANLTAQTSYTDLDVTVTMGGVDVTETAYSGGTIHIETVTGDIAIHAAGTREPMNFRWELEEGGLVSSGKNANAVTKLAGTVTDGVLDGARYQLENAVMLQADRPWVLEWKCAGDWRGVILGSDPPQLAAGRYYISRTKGGQLCIGIWDGKQYDNYGVDLSEVDSQTHTYRMENRIAADGSNMIWLSVDGVEIGPMNNYFIGSKAQGTTSDWVSGRDFLFPYIGSDSTTLDNCPLDYLAVWEDGQPSLKGKTISILGASISTYAGTSNGAAADTTNSTIRNNAKYYPNSVVTDVTLKDTWWMQAADDLGLRLLVNNSWSGSSLLHERNGTVGAYVDRCVQLHDDTGDNAGEMPDIIAIQMGTNDFQYYKDTLGTADIDYAALIQENADGTYTYGTPVTSLEAAAIVLHKISVRYPNAEVYYLNISQRIDGTDELIRSFNAELKQVVEHFGAHIVDIYGSGITMENFDTYIGDGKVHPNCLGMDAYTEAFKAALLANTGYAVNTHLVTFDLTNVTADYGTNKTVVSGDAFRVRLTAAEEDELSVTVTMGGEDITASAYSDGVVAIGAVTADVVITAVGAEHEPRDYRWEFDGTDLVSVGETANKLTKNAGTTTNGVFSKTRYALEKAVVLSHTKPWIVEWKSEGTFKNSNGSSGARIFTSTDVNGEYNARYIFKSATNWLIAMGEKDTKGSHNYGIALADHGIDGSEPHTYRLENRIAADGSNMIWLYVDGAEIGPMNNYYVGTTSQKTTSDWLSGKDFTFPYMGTDTHGFTNAAIEYIQIFESHTHSYESVVTAPTCTEQGYTTHTCACGDSFVDSYVDALGHNYKGLVCDACGKVIQPIAGDSELYITVAPDNYWTISNMDTEKLACGPGMVAYGEGNFAVVYLADDINTVETESSTTIVCRLGLFNIKDPEHGKFLDVATAGQTIGDVTIGEKAPYEPNLMKLSDSKLLILFNIHTTSGKYIYYGAVFDTVSNTIETYQPLTLDGKEWTPANIAASYNALAENSISTSGPAGSMVFTSQIIQHEGYFYGYCGGISNGFSGILVRSADGINWESVMTPEAAGDMKGVIECGFQFLDDSVYFCMRDISSGVYHCAYRFPTGGQLMNTQKLPSLTTSKPTAFIQNGEIYLIVNKYTGDDNTVGRRNTAQIYRVNPETFGLILVKQVFCKDGCAYHTVVEYGGINYWCFHTDARRINPYSQGRSNLAFLPMPMLVESSSENGELNFDVFANCYANGCITGATNGWQAGAVNMHYQIPLAVFADYDVVTITANDTNKCYLAFFTKKMTTQTQIAYAEGWTEQLIMEPGTSQTLSIPEDAQYLYILATNAAGNDLIPESVVFHTHTYESVVTAPTCTEQGYTTHTCTECGDSYVDSYTDTVGHSWANGVCTLCGATKKPYQRLTYFTVDVQTADGKSYMDNAVLYLPKTYSPNGEPVKLVIYCKQGSSQISSSSNPIESVGFYNYLISLGYAVLGVDGVPDAWRDELGLGERAVGNPIAVQGTEKAYDYVIDNYNIAADGCFISGYSQGGHYAQNVIDLTDIPILAAAEQSPVCSMRYHQWDLNASQTVGGVKFTKAARLNVARIYGFPAVATNADLLNLAYDGSLVAEYDPWVRNSKNVYSGFVQKSNLWYLPEGTSVDDITMTHSAKCPVKIWCAEDDTAISADVMKVFVKAIQNAGGIAEISVAESGGHGFFQKQTAVGTFTENGKTYKTLPIAVEIGQWFARFGGYECQHDYTSVVTAPNCTEQGYTTHTCECGDSYVDSYINALGHAYGEWYVTKEATLESEGEERRDCDRCDDFQTRKIPKLVHNYTSVVTDPTCTEQGYTTHICQNCGDEYVDTYVAALGHSFKNYLSNDDATCTTDGTKTAKCERCDETDTVRDIGTAKGHSFGKWTVTTEPTCTEKGMVRRDCENCDHFEIREVEETAHDYEAVVTKPTCTEQGYTIHTCSKCGDTYKDSYVDAAGHSFGKWTVTTEPTCTEKGMVRRDCENCDHFEIREVEETAHDYEAVVTKPTCTEQGYTIHTCSKCGDSYVDSYVDATGHKFGEWVVTTDPTCTEKGTEQRKCDNCDHYETREVEATGHDYEAVVTKPTCTEQGYTTHTCTICGDSYVDSYVNALGHAYGEWYVTKEATLESEGEERRDCDRCDDFQTRKIPKLVHNYTSVVTEPTCTEQGYTTHTCTDCGDSYMDTHIDALGHSFKDYVSNNDASCTADGTKTAKCERCDAIDTVTDAGTAKGHALSDWTVVTQPTCTEKGEERRDCANCDHFETREVEATGHDYEAVVTESTCTEQGYTTHTCTICGDSYMDSYVNALGHEYGGWYVTKEATLESEGEERRDCDRCDDFQTRKIPKLVHSYTSVVTDPTCTEQGYTTHTCQNCGDEYVDTYVAALGHSFKNYVSNEDATCTTDGTKTAKCERCDETDTVRDIGTAKGHSYGKWTVTTEPSCEGIGEERRDCANCNHFETREVEATGHDYEVVVNEPTCTEKGYTTHTCVECGDTYKVSYVDAIGHKFGDWTETKAPSCIEVGAERRDCDNCDHFETREVEATGHKYEAVVTKPTCEEKGYTTHTCSKCGDTYKDSYVDAIGHKFGDWTVTDEPTCTEVGAERRDCENCDHFETREVEAIGHDYEAVVTKPTCTERGYTTHTCSKCGDSYVDSYVNALGHEFQNGTCTNCGEPEVKYLRGDVDLDGNVDVDDVLALLWYVLFPDDYPIEVDANFDGNGSTDVDDVLTLLWYVLFPEEYPLN